MLKKLTIVAVLALMSQGAKAGWIVGNGGDSLRLAFFKAKQHAAYITMRLNERSLGANVSPEVATWIRKNRDALASDIVAADHDWTMDAKPTCAWTSRSRADKIELSYPTCRDSIENFEEASLLLLHEAVHHFGIRDEQFADGVAHAIFTAWKSGHTDWLPTGTAGVGEERTKHSAVWTGKDMIVFGGLLHGGEVSTQSGYKYLPNENRWEAISTEGAPSRYMHEAVWTGEKMIIWGGFEKKEGHTQVWQNSGAIYDPESDQWTPLATPFGPAETGDYVDEWKVQTAVWTGTKLIVWGGTPTSGGEPLGGVYDLETGKWTKISAEGAPLRKAGHSAVWTGSRMIVWGGFNLSNYRTGEGAAYDPKTNRWTAISATGAPRARDSHAAVWTGSEMIVFGGFESTVSINGTGGVYNPKTNLWTSFETELAPGRVGHTVVWTGSEVIVWGGKSKRLRTLFNAVSIFNPLTMTWHGKESNAAPEGRRDHTAVWTGGRMVVFGGSTGHSDVSATGGIFIP